VFPSPVVNFLFIPWDFVLILLFLGTVVPWRGAARMKRLLAKPQLTSADRLSLYGSTILLQWLIVVIVAWRCAARSVGPDELGLAASDPWRIAGVSVVLTGVLCLNQILGLRKIARLPQAQRGSLFALTERIMPQTKTESLVYAALSCTAGISEEFLYRGFVLTALVRMVVNFIPPNAVASALSAAWFSLGHVYQGRRGIITTFVVGILFASVRVWTGSLIPVIVAHIGIDMTIGFFAPRLLRAA
jgi:membrane protease YdiL (CAAX protease family)